MLSSTAGSDINADAALAVDGLRSQFLDCYDSCLFIHTEGDDYSPWFRVVFPHTVTVRLVVVFNRNMYTSRLKNGEVTVYDNDQLDNPRLCYKIPDDFKAHDISMYCYDIFVGKVVELKLSDRYLHFQEIEVYS